MVGNVSTRPGKAQWSGQSWSCKTKKEQWPNPKRGTGIAPFSCDTCTENRRFLSLFCFRFVRPENTKKPHKHWISQYLPGFLKSGAEGNRTPVRKSIPCSSTIIVPYLTFPLPSGKKHSDGFSSFIIRPHTQSFACVVSYIVDARVLKCRCLKSDSCHQAAYANSSLAFIFNFAI